MFGRWRAPLPAASESVSEVVGLSWMELSGAVEHQSYVTSESRMPLGSSDESLLEASANGDQRAFAELYERHARAIYNFLFRRLADWSEAEDLTAVVFSRGIPAAIGGRRRRRQASALALRDRDERASQSPARALA